MFAAGVLIYYKDKRTGEISFLLGNDFRNVLSDFGGKEDPEDNNDPRITASRECYEETMGLLFSFDHIHNLVFKSSFVIGTSYMKKKYYMYLLHLDLKINTDILDEKINILKGFHLEDHLSEKNRIQWVSSKYILENKNKDIRKVFYETFSMNYRYIIEIIDR